MRKTWANWRQWVLILLGIELMSEKAQKICSRVGSIFILSFALIPIVLMPFALFFGKLKEILMTISGSVVMLCVVLAWFLGIKEVRNWKIWVIVLLIIAVMFVLLLAYLLFFFRL